jgi:hypothetical protein
MSEIAGAAQRNGAACRGGLHFAPRCAKSSRDKHPDVAKTVATVQTIK